MAREGLEERSCRTLAWGCTQLDYLSWYVAVCKMECYSRKGGERRIRHQAMPEASRTLD